MNWSGCGNDLRCSAAMARRLIRDSLMHMVTVFGVDGFRFDLAELIGSEVLEEIEAAMTRSYSWKEEARQKQYHEIDA